MGHAGVAVSDEVTETLGGALIDAVMGAFTGA